MLQTKIQRTSATNVVPRPDQNNPHPEPFTIKRRHSWDQDPLKNAFVQALSRGGRYTLDNIAPACRSCNASKSNDEVTGWLRRKQLDERAFLQRHIEIQQILAGRFPAEPPEG